MKFRPKTTTVAAIALAMGGLSGSATLSQDRSILFWPNRASLHLTGGSLAEEPRPVSLSLDVPSPFGLTVGEKVSLSISVEGDAEGVTYRAAASSDMPGFSVDVGNGAVSGMPDAPAGTLFVIAVEAVKGGTVVGTTQTLSRILRNPLDIDIIPDDVELRVGTPLPTLAVGAVGGDQGSIAWSLENAPGWLEIKATGPGEAVLSQAGGQEVTETPRTTVNIVASDGEGRMDVEEIAVEASSVVTPKWREILAGNGYTCGITEAGDTYCWGYNRDGQLGNDSTTDSDVPVKVSGDYSFVEIAAGTSHTCAITETGETYCWGDDAFGQLGNGNNGKSRVPVNVAVNFDFVKITAGKAHTCAITKLGYAYCWGDGGKGQLGNNSITSEDVPISVYGFHTFAEISAGDEHTCGITKTGDAYCWGYNFKGQLGKQTYTIFEMIPVPVSSDFSFVEIAAGGDHTCGITEAGDTYCWGYNRDGQLGNGSTAQSYTPVKVLGNYSFVKIAAGSSHTCAITETGETYCWGHGAYGQLGNGSTTNSYIPVKVYGDYTFVEITAFNRHTCAITKTGEVYCWGHGAYGQLGNGSNVDSDVPVAVVGPDGP